MYSTNYIITSCHWTTPIVNERCWLLPNRTALLNFRHDGDVWSEAVLMTPRPALLWVSWPNRLTGLNYWPTCQHPRPLDTAMAKVPPRVGPYQVPLIAPDLYTRGVSWSLPVFSIKKTLNSQGNLKKILFKVLTIGFYTFYTSFRQIMDTIPKKLLLFQGKLFHEPFFDFFKIGEALLYKWVSHRCEKVIVGRVEVWRVRRVR